MSAFAGPFTDWFRANNDSIIPERNPDYGIGQIRQVTGLEHHSKNEEDEFLSEVDHRMAEAQLRRDIMVIDDII